MAIQRKICYHFYKDPWSGTVKLAYSKPSMNNVRNKIVDWNRLEHVLLDMDGTLLDRYFDDYFWEHLVPEKYAEKNNITFGKAKEELFKKYKFHEGTLNWTDLDFWSSELDLDIPALKEQIKHLIEIHPYVEEFLSMLKRYKKKVYLVTNAHYRSIEIKLKKTAIGRYFDSVISSFDVGYPKESLKFWEKAEKILGFKKDKTLLIDDTAEVLRTARAYGIRYLLLKARPNSRISPETSHVLATGQGSGQDTRQKKEEFGTILDFKDLIVP